MNLLVVLPVPCQKNCWAAARVIARVESDPQHTGGQVKIRVRAKRKSERR